MSSIIKLGPDGGPFVELDEDTGDFIIRVPNDSIDFDQSELSNISDLVANSATIDGNDSPYAQDPHDVGGAQHSADTLANLNTKVSDATLDDETEERPPEAHSGEHEDGGVDEISVANLSGELADPQPSQTQDDGDDVVATPTLNFGNGLDVSDNAGVADVDFNAEDVGLDSNQPDWQEDGNSPMTVSESESETYTLDGEYDEVMVRGRVGDAGDVYLTVNGDTGNNYDYYTIDGANKDGEADVHIAFTDGFVFEMQGKWGDRWGVFNSPRVAVGYTASTAFNSTVTSPLTEFTITSTTNMNGVIEVYGRDIA